MKTGILPFFEAPPSEGRSCVHVLKVHKSARKAKTVSGDSQDASVIHTLLWLRFSTEIFVIPRSKIDFPLCNCGKCNENKRLRDTIAAKDETMEQYGATIWPTGKADNEESPTTFSPLNANKTRDLQISSVGITNSQGTPVFRFYPIRQVPQGMVDPSFKYRGFSNVRTFCVCPLSYTVPISRKGGGPPGGIPILGSLHKAHIYASIPQSFQAFPIHTGIRKDDSPCLVCLSLRYESTKVKKTLDKRYHL